MGRAALIDVAKQRAATGGSRLITRSAIGERLDRAADASFDVVSSTCGIKFAPDHVATAKQLARVLEKGGRLGLANWTPEGGLGKLTLERHISDFHIRLRAPRNAR